LAGPITRDKLQELNNLVGARQDLISMAPGVEKTESTIKSTEVRSASREALPGSPREPILSSKVNVVYLPLNRNLSEALKELDSSSDSTSNPLYHYQPALIGQATVYFSNRSYNLDTQMKVAVRIPKLESRGLVHWENYQIDPIDSATLEGKPLPNATFGDLAYPFDDENTITALSKDFIEWIAHNQTYKLFTNTELKLISNPGESREAFEERCKQVSSTSNTVEIEKIQQKYAKLKKTIEDKKQREELELEKDKTALNQRRTEEAIKGIENVAKLFGRKKSNLSASMTKRRMTSTAQASVKESEEMIKNTSKI